MTRPAPPRTLAHRRPGYHIWLLVLLAHVAGVAAVVWLSNHPGHVLFTRQQSDSGAVIQARWLGASVLAPHPDGGAMASSVAVSGALSRSANIAAEPLAPAFIRLPIPKVRNTATTSPSTAHSSSIPQRTVVVRTVRNVSRSPVPAGSVQRKPQSVVRTSTAKPQPKNSVAAASLPALSRPASAGASTQAGGTAASAVAKAGLASSSPVVGNASMAEEPGGPVITQAHYRQTPVPVEYPPLARRRGMEGRVLVQVWLDAAGEQLKREIVASSGSALLDQAALRSVAQNQFLPYTRDGVGMAARLRLPVIFSLHP
jgi:periplasmic protein TonB